MRFLTLKASALPWWFLTVVVLVSVPGATSAQSDHVYLANRMPADGVEIHYDVTVAEPNRHLYDIDLIVTGLTDEQVDVTMPAWAPGAYRIVDYARNVQSFSAATAGDGRPLAWEKTSKQTWRIAKFPAEDLHVSYSVYSRDLTAEMADLAGPAIYMYVEGHKHVPVTLEYHLPPGWNIYTGLSGEERQFEAPDYDVLIDAPAFLGRPRVLQFFYDDERYRLVFSDPDVEFDQDALLSDMRAIVASAVDIFGSTPFSNYTFLFHVDQNPGSSGLEHLNSTRISVGWNDLADPEGYERFLYVAAHEFFHVWNVKWIRPQVLGPFDYTREAQTRLLWVSEGITSYYGRLLLVRAGILTPEAYMESLADQIGSFQQSPGRFLMSNEEASWNTWLSSDNAANDSISYYTKGEIAGLLLDLELRARTGNERNLDDVMRYLMQTWAARGIGVPEDGFLEALNAVSETEFGPMYQELARDRGEPSYDQYLAHAGLSLHSDADSSSLYMGVRIEPADEGRPRILSVVDSSPAQRAGLDRNDILLSLDGRPITMETLTSELNNYSVGDVVEVGFRRGRREMEVSLEPIENPQERWRIDVVPNPTPEQRDIRDNWLSGSGR